MKILCKIFGHPDRPHYHEETDVVSCNGGCEQIEGAFKIEPCKRCVSIEPSRKAKQFIEAVDAEMARIEKERRI